MKSPGAHRVARILAMLVVGLSALPTIQDSANPQHMDAGRALLAGSLWIDTPSTLHDVGEIDGRFFAPFPPLPALLAAAALLTPWPDPVFNLAVLLAALAAVALAGRLGDRWGGRAAGTWAAAALGLGSGLWTAAVIHDTYHSAHVLAVLSVMGTLVLATGERLRSWAGLALGIGALARQAVMLAALPVAALAGGCWWNPRSRRVAAGVLVSAALPIAVYLCLNTARFGSPFESGYALVQHHPRIAADVHAHGVFSLHYLPRNLGLMLAGRPELVGSPPYVLPDPAGMSVLLLSPWLVFALLPLLCPDRPQARRTAAWCWAAALLVSVPHLLYVNTGWVQFGFRFALDWLPFVLLAAILGVRRLSWRVAVPPLALAIVVNAWGVAAVVNWESWSALVP